MDEKKIIDALHKAYIEFKDYEGGQNASYIPYLANVNSKLCGISVVTRDGKIFNEGDTDYRFAIESISKVCTLALAMSDVGLDAVRVKVGDSPTGLPFNSIIALELHNGKPLSPLVNAGAMATTSLIKAEDNDGRFARILDMQRCLMSENVSLSEEVNQSEQMTNFHNRAIAWLLYSAGYMYSEPMDACEVYTKACSTLVSATDLATLAATLSNHGIHPITQKRVIDERYVPKILAEMTMEGLYDGSGDFAYMVGLPAKSGVGGGLLAVVPNVMGIAAFAPPLDEFGNSVRGQKMIAKFADLLDLNIYK